MNELAERFAEQVVRSNIRRSRIQTLSMEVEAYVPILGDIEVRFSDWCPYSMIVEYDFVNKWQESVDSPWGTSLFTYNAEDIMDVLLRFDVLTSFANRGLKAKGLSPITKRELSDYTLKSSRGTLELEHKYITNIEFRGTVIRYYGDYEYESHARLSVFDRWGIQPEIVQLDEYPLEDDESPTLELLSEFELYSIDTICKQMPYVRKRVQAHRKWR